MVWNLAIEYPDKFAAHAPVCGWGNSDMVSRIKDIPVWVFHGELDTSVPIKKGKEIVEALAEISSNVKTSIYPGRGHDCWHETYNDPILYEWFLQHRRENYDK